MSEAIDAAPVAAQDNVAIEAKSSESNENSDLDSDDHLIETESKSEIPSKKEVAEVKKMLNKLKIKFNGKEVEEELPFEIPDDEKSREYMQKHLQMSKLGNSSSQEKAKLEKMVVDFITELKTNPRKALSNPNIGIDLKKLAMEVVEEEIENSKKSPDQIEREKLESRLKELEAEKKTKEEEYRTKEMSRLQEQEMMRYDTLMSQALEKSDLPKSPYVVKKMADYMILGLQNNIDLSPNDVVPLVRDEIMNDIKDMFGVMPAEVLKEVIGKDNLDKIRKYNMSKAKTKPVATTNTISKDVGVSKGNEEKKDDKKVSYKEMFGSIF